MYLISTFVHDDSISFVVTKPQYGNVIQLHANTMRYLGLSIGQQVIVNHDHALCVKPNNTLRDLQVLLSPALGEIIGVKQKEMVIVHDFESPVLKASHISLHSR